MRGITGSVEDVPSTTRNSSRKYRNSFQRLKPLARQMLPNTTKTKKPQAMYKVMINFASEPSEVMPYCPTVNANAPKAPMGAKRIR
ncbi:hypothetical protein D3C71_1449940 [compost metagenome]